ncbi:MAG TPA: GWxTD domain-containing protein [Acidobacteriota bacterium]
MKTALHFQVALLLAGLAGVPPAGAVEDPTLAEVARVTEQWPEGPVRYLLTRAEINAYKRMESLEDRLRFIALFWARRDPDPITERNEFKEQFEARVRYASANFKERGIEGWRTHRGQIFLIFGPPDQTEQRILEGGRTVARRAFIWHYDRRVFQNIAPNASLVFYDMHSDQHFYLLPPLYWGQTYFERYLGFQETPSLHALPTSYAREVDRTRQQLVVNPEARLADPPGETQAVTLNHVPFIWTTEVATSGDHAEVRLKVDLRYRDLSFSGGENRYHTVLDFRARLRGPAGEQYDERKRRVDLQLTESELSEKASKDEVHSFEEVLAGPPGPARLELLLSDRTLGQANINLQRQTLQLPSPSTISESRR